MVARRRRDDWPRATRQSDLTPRARRRRRPPGRPRWRRGRPRGLRWSPRASSVRPRCAAMPPSTVEWSRLPNMRPISATVLRPSSLSTYMARWRAYVDVAASALARRSPAASSCGGRRSRPRLRATGAAPARAGPAASGDSARSMTSGVAIARRRAAETRSRGSGSPRARVRSGSSVRRSAAARRRQGAARGGLPSRAGSRGARRTKGYLHVGDEAPLQARAQASLSRVAAQARGLPRSTICLPHRVQLVEGVKELLLELFFALEELDIVRAGACRAAVRGCGTARCRCSAFT